MREHHRIGGISVRLLDCGDCVQTLKPLNQWSECEWASVVHGQGPKSGAPFPGDDLRSKSAIRLRGQNCTQRFFEACELHWRTARLSGAHKLVQILAGDFFCGNDTVAVAMHFAMKNSRICFSLRKFLAISSAIQKSVSRKGGRNKGGRKQMRANANKSRHCQTLTNASKRRGENASKRKQMRANGDKRKQTLTPPFMAFFYTPLCNPLEKSQAIAVAMPWCTESRTRKGKIVLEHPLTLVDIAIFFGGVKLF